MCWEFKDVFTDCPVDCSRWKTTKVHPAYGQICPDFAVTRQHCKNPIQVILGEKARKCPDHQPFGRYWNTQEKNSSSQVQASGVNPDPGGPTETPNSNNNQLQFRSHQNPHSAHQTATQTSFRSGLPSNLSPRQQRGVWHNQASNLIYPDNNGVPPLGTYDRSSLSPDRPDPVVVSSSTNQQTNSPPENPGHWSISNHPNQGHSSQENRRNSEPWRDLAKDWGRRS
ncbi:uncharacterized protein Bfra_008233 [Botrytis fragariae]|uniref:Uncharacterized protein n=1 Tax=Botrytis fragariae TaxID=1964551 RepID=A0A8H6EI12_9HELO|nr:uncharacterized protein Bfra_008233 [Botrytis fragariae]KAF5872956.1 hypothetical protein Bfra_008233 [Botrytis fragariae]